MYKRQILKLSIFGQSHSPAIGCSLDGIPAGIDVDFERLQEFLNRRAPGRDETSTTRRESDAPEVIAGITNGFTNGAPIAAIIRNGNTRSQDYDELRRKPRPGPVSYTHLDVYKRQPSTSIRPEVMVPVLSRQSTSTRASVSMQ